MKPNWPTVLKWMGVSEGGYVNDPVDPGGPTNMGVTQRTYDAWTGSDKSVKHITKREVSQIFKSQYWDKVLGDQLASGLDYAVTDFAVNSGPSRAIRELQEIVGVTADGVIGAHTLEAIDGQNTQELIIAYCGARLAYMKRLKIWWKFGRGWTIRVMGHDKGVQGHDIGVIDRAVRMARGAEDIPPPRTEAPHKAAGDVSLSTTLTDAVKNPQAITAIGGAVGSVAAVASGSGPVQYALAAVLVLGALVGVFMLVRRGNV